MNSPYTWACKCTVYPLRTGDCLAGHRVLKSKCEADVYLELINLRTGQPEALPSVEIAVRVRALLGQWWGRGMQAMPHRCSTCVSMQLRGNNGK